MNKLWSATKERSGDAVDAARDVAGDAVDAARDAAGDALDKVRDGSAAAVDSTRRGAENAWEETREGSKRFLEAAKPKAGEVVGHAAEEGKEVLDEAREKGRELWRKVAGEEAARDRERVGLTSSRAPGRVLVQMPACRQAARVRAFGRSRASDGISVGLPRDCPLRTSSPSLWHFRGLDSGRPSMSGWISSGRRAEPEFARATPSIARSSFRGRGNLVEDSDMNESKGPHVAIGGSAGAWSMRCAHCARGTSGQSRSSRSAWDASRRRSPRSGRGWRSTRTGRAAPRAGRPRFPGTRRAGCRCSGFRWG